MLDLECRNCQFYYGDCGRHPTDVYGHINYERCSDGNESNWGICAGFSPEANIKDRCMGALSESDIREPLRSIIRDALEKHWNSRQ